MTAVVFTCMYFLVLLRLLTSMISVGSAIEVTVSRQQNVGFNDYFSLKTCDSNFYKWCSKMFKGAYIYKGCSCRCDRPITFLVYERKCVSIDYLKTLKDFFGKGVYIFEQEVDLNNNGSILTERKSDGCKIDKVKYLKGNVWYNYTNPADWKIDNYNLTWVSTSSADPKGRIFMIQLRNCSRPRGGQSKKWYSSDPKVFFKSRGNFSFNMSSSSVLPTQALTTSACSNHETCLISSPSLSNIIPTATPAIPGTTTPTPAFPGTTTPTSTPVAIPTAFNSSAGARTSKKGSPTGAIVGSVLACIAVIAGVIVLIVVWKKRKQRLRSSSADRSVKVPPDSNNLLYGKNQGEVITLSQRKEQEGTNAAKGDEEYDYATVDGGPDYHGNKPVQQVYQSLTQQPVQDSVYTALNQDKNASPEPSYLYNHLQRPEYKPHCPPNPPNALYSSLEKPKEHDYLEPGVHIDAVNSKKTSEPLYNTLEDPNSEEAPPHDEPLYNVLEDPDSDYDNAPTDSDLNHPDSQDNAAYLPAIDSEDHCCPDCDVLEGPNSKGQQPDTKHDPVYAVLEGPDGPTSDPSYQALDIRADENVYQPLDRTTQPIYQPLNKAPNTRGRDSTA